MAEQMSQLSLAIARQKGEEGMRAATARAEAESPGLTDVMYAYLVKFAVRCERGQRFGAEDVTLAFREDQGFESPKDDRSWGGVFVRATNNGIIAWADNDGTRKRGHGVKGSKRYRSLVIGRQWTSFDFTPPRRRRGKAKEAPHGA